MSGPRPLPTLSQPAAPLVSAALFSFSLYSHGQDRCSVGRSVILPAGVLTRSPGCVSLVWEWKVFLLPKIFQRFLWKGRKLEAVLGGGAWGVLPGAQKSLEGSCPFSLHSSNQEERTSDSLILLSLDISSAVLIHPPDPAVSRAV